MTKAPDPVEKSLHVPLSPTRAFELFTKGIETWWPVDSHSISAAKGERPREIRLEPKLGGQLVETTSDGHHEVWGHVTTWEPGKRLGMAWYVGRGAAEATGFEVVFTEDGTGTRVDLTHGGWTALGTEASATRERYLTGWDLVLAGFQRCALAPQPIPV